MNNNKLRHLIDLVTILAQKELKVRYKSSFLGYLWSIANPFAFAIVFYIAFKVIMRIQMEDYPLFIITGLFPWQWFSNSVNFSSRVFIDNALVIKKLNFERSLLPLAACLHDMIHFAASIPIIFLFLFIYGHKPFFSWIYGIPLLLATQLIWTYGLCLIASSLTLFFRDLERLIAIALMLLFYFTPVVYPESMIPNDYKHFLFLNPQALLISNWRNLFYQGSLNLTFLLVGFLYSIASLAIGCFVYKKLSWKFAEVL